MKLKELNEVEVIGNSRVVWIKTDGYEFKVPSPDGREEASYFTTNKDEAVDTVKQMYGDEIVIKFRSVPTVE